MECDNKERLIVEKEVIIQKLREQGCRITRQRLLLIEVILENDCSSSVLEHWEEITGH